MVKRTSFGARVIVTGLLFIMVMGTGVVTVHAQKPVDLDAIYEKLQEMQAVIEQQQEEIQRLKKALHDITEEQNQARQEQEQAIKKQVKQEVEERTKPLAWAEKLKISGDFRGRYEGIYNRERDGEKLEDRNRLRVRLRLNGDAHVTDEIGAHLRLSTSDSQFGQTSNQSLDDEFDNKAIFIARAYVDYRPHWLPDLELGFGKFKNPYLHSDISFDPDVNPEGLYDLYTYKRWKTVQPFIRFGQHIISENNLTKDGSMFLWQGGVHLGFSPVALTLAGSYYDYNSLDRTRLGESSRAKGNTTMADPETGDPILAYDFEIAEAIAFVSFPIAGHPVTVWGDYLRNTAKDVPGDRDTAWRAGFDVGRAKNPGEWKFEYMYKRIESDAVLGLFADGDFYGTNRRGHRWKFTYRMLKSLSFQGAFFVTDAIRGELPENRLQMNTILNF